MSKSKFKKGFTIIELIVVIAILGILVLLAAPKFLGYTEKAKVVQIQSDIKGLETAINSKLLEDPELLKGEPPVSNDTIKGYQSKSTLYHISKDSSVVSNQDGLGGVFYKVNPELMNKVGFKSNLKGEFYYSENDGKVYFNRDKSSGSEPSVPEEPKPIDPDPSIPYAKPSDFKWIEDTGGYNVTSKPSKGYYSYTGTSESVKIPHSIGTDPITSYYRMFYGSPLTTLKVVSNNSNVTSMKAMFENSQITSLDINNLDTSNVIDMDNMFANMQATSLNLNNFNTSKVESMRAMFYGSQVTNLDLSSFDTSNVTNMSLMFDNSKSTSLNLSSFKTHKVKEMEQMFNNSSVTTLDLSGFNTSSTENMDSMFAKTSIETLDLSSFDTFNVRNMSYMFYNSKITNLNLTSFTTIRANDMDWMFYNSKVATLDLSSFDVSYVNSMKSMFKGASTTLVYASTQENVEILNSTSNKPETLIIKVK